MRITGNGAYSNIELNSRIAALKPDDPAFVRELVYGVLRYERTLDFYLSQLVNKGFDRLDARVLNILRMGLYQLLYTVSVPAYAAVNESVRLAKEYCPGRDRFVNAVLRNFLRREETLKTPGSCGSTAERLSVKYSFDPWITQVWTEMFGEERAESLMTASNTTPSLTVRVNELKISREELAVKLEKKGFRCELSAISPHVIKIRGSGNGLLDDPLFKEGTFFVQDEAASAAVDALGISRGDRVLDVCAAPGGKSFAAAILAEDSGTVSACDIYPQKIRLIEKGAERLGLKSVHTGLRDAAAAEPAAELSETVTETGDAPHEAADSEIKPEEMMSYKSGTCPGDAAARKNLLYDCIICDVPCTGLGVLRKKPEIKYKKIADKGETIAKIQYTILDRSKIFLRPGGRVLYCTCTINRTENENVAERFLDENPSFRAVSERQFFPDRDGTDGIFYSVFEKID